MTWFCSWLSDVEADGSGPIREVSSTLCGLRMEESGEKRGIKESEVRSQLHVTSHGRLLFRQKQSRQEEGRNLGKSLQSQVLEELETQPCPRGTPV